MINLGTFADDTLLWSKPYNKNNKQKTELLQRELNSFAHWSTMWKLVINADKCDYLRIIGQFTKRFGEPPKLSIAGTQLKQVDHLRYLGLWLDDKLNFNHHIEKTKMTCMGRLSSLYRLAINYDLRSNTLVSIYKAQTRPIWEYALPIYWNARAQDELQKIQNRFIRLAYPTAKHAPVEILHVIANIPPVRFHSWQPGTNC